MSYCQFLPSELLFETLKYLDDYTKLSEVPEFQDVLINGTFWRFKFTWEFPRINWELIPKINYTEKNIIYYVFIYIRLKKSYKIVSLFLMKLSENIDFMLDQLAYRHFGKTDFGRLTQEQFDEISILAYETTRLSLDQMTDIRVLTLDLTGNLTPETKLKIYEIYGTFNYEPMRLKRTLFENSLDFSSSVNSVEYTISNQEVFNLLFHLKYNGSKEIYKFE